MLYNLIFLNRKGKVSGLDVCHPVHSATNCVIPGSVSFLYRGAWVGLRLSKQQPQKEQRGSSGHYEAFICLRIQFVLNTEKNRHKLTKVHPLRITASIKHIHRKRAGTSQGLIRTKPLGASKVSDCLGKGNRGHFSGQGESLPLSWFLKPQHQVWNNGRK